MDRPSHECGARGHFPPSAEAFRSPGAGDGRLVCRARPARPPETAPEDHDSRPGPGRPLIRAPQRRAAEGQDDLQGRSRGVPGRVVPDRREVQAHRATDELLRYLCGECGAPPGAGTAATSEGAGKEEAFPRAASRHPQAPQGLARRTTLGRRVIRGIRTPYRIRVDGDILRVGLSAAISKFRPCAPHAQRERIGSALSSP